MIENEKPKKYIDEIKSLLVGMAMALGIALVISNDMHPSGTKAIPILGITLLIIFPILFSIHEVRLFSKESNRGVGKYIDLETSFLGENIPDILQILSFSAILGLYLKAYSLLILITAILLIFYLHFKRNSSREIKKAISADNT